MKKSLFAVVVLLSVYVLFAFAFTSLDNQGKFTQILNDVGLSNATVAAATIGSPGSDSGLNSDLIDPIPPPERKPPPHDPDVR